MSKEIAIEVKNLSKSFRLPTERANGIKQAVINRLKGVRGYKEQKVLRNISFNIKKGDFFGIVGRNGSGKSTLLKLISGIYEPGGGFIKVNGSLVSFIELGVGFNPQLTGRENVYLNGALLGFSVREIDMMYDEIVDFAELGEFMDQKLKNYSSGMQVRLAFSCAIRAKSDILVLDEVLAVGDEAFQRKCNDYFYQLKKRKKTVVLVTHNMNAVRQFCNRAIMIHDGKIVVDGGSEDVTNGYSLENANVISAAHGETVDDSVIRNIKVELLSPQKISETQSARIRVTYGVAKNIKTKIMLNLVDMDRRVPLYAGSTNIIDGRAGTTIEKVFKISLNEINDANIQVALSIRDENSEILAFPPEIFLPSFILRRQDYPDKNKKPSYAILFDRGKWS